jgi:hypothetical protein
MIQAGEYSDTLRAVGRFLDDVSATGIEIGERDDHWLVAWDQGGMTHLQVFELEALRTVGRMHRGTEGSTPRFNLSQILRTLGQLLDNTEASGFTIYEVPEGYYLSARVGGRGIERTYSVDEIRSLASQQQAVRGQGAGAASNPC